MLCQVALHCVHIRWEMYRVEDIVVRLTQTRQVAEQSRMGYLVRVPRQRKVQLECVCQPVQDGGRTLAYLVDGRLLGRGQRTGR
jgi:hypothetical protein